MVDSYKTLTCPACGAVMKKIFIPSAGINIDICSENCGGIFFDNLELQKFNKAADDISEIKKVLDGKSFTAVDESKTKICPACGKPMVKTSVKGLKIQIDSCYSCGGVFLDNGELELIRQGVRKITVNDLKIQSGVLDENTIQTFYKEMQQEELLNNRTISVANILFGSPRHSGWGRRRYGLIDFIFDILR